MATSSEKQRLLYANLMHEVKIRIDAINLAVQGHLRLADPFVREFCWLQLRMLCELIAPSCLVAHGDITFLQPHKVGKAYSADDILDRLTKLRPHFYPFPIRTEKRAMEGAPGFFHEATGLDSPLPKEDLLRLYAVAHRHLHRGSLKKLLSMDVHMPWEVKLDAPEIVQWAQKMNDLLSQHAIAISQDLIWLCVLRNVDDGNKVQVVTAEASANDQIRQTRAADPAVSTGPNRRT